VNIADAPVQALIAVCAALCTFSFVAAGWYRPEPERLPVHLP
jgi:hypothetical protein